MDAAMINPRNQNKVNYFIYFIAIILFACNQSNNVKLKNQALIDSLEVDMKNEMLSCEIDGDKADLLINEMERIFESKERMRVLFGEDYKVISDTSPNIYDSLLYDVTYTYLFPDSTYFKYIYFEFKNTTILSDFQIRKNCLNKLPNNISLNNSRDMFLQTFLRNNSNTCEIFKIGDFEAQRELVYSFNENNLVQIEFIRYFD